MKAANEEAREDLEHCARGCCFVNGAKKTDRKYFALEFELVFDKDGLRILTHLAVLSNVIEDLDLMI